MIPILSCTDHDTNGDDDSVDVDEEKERRENAEGRSFEKIDRIIVDIFLGLVYD